MYGKQISRIGIGTLRFPKICKSGREMNDEETANEIIATAYKKGVNYFDCAPTYCMGRCEEIVGNALRPFRDEVLVSTKVPLDVLKKQGDVRHFLEKSLHKLKTDYLDYYYFWAVHRSDFIETAIRGGFLREMAELKQEGLIKGIGFSFHDKPSYATEIIDVAQKEGIPFDAMLCQYNPLCRDMAPYIKYAKGQGLTTLVMGAAAGGKIDYRTGYKFVLGNPNVDCMLSGVQNPQMLMENLVLEKDHPSAETEFQDMPLLRLYCTGCGYCQPCPAGIHIPEILDICQQEVVHSNKEEADKRMRAYVLRYGDFTKKCLDCGMCEKRCPQNVKIRKYIKRISLHKNGEQKQ